MDADNSYEYFSSLKEKLENNNDFYHKIAGLCMLAAIGASEEIKKNAKTQLEDFLNPALEVIPNTWGNITEIHLVNISKAQSLWVLSVPAHYRAFSDFRNIVYLSSTN